MLSGLLSLGGKGKADRASTSVGYDFDDGYDYPCVYHEAGEMLSVAMLIYVMTDLRILAKQNQLERGPERILDLPTTVEATIRCIEDNSEQIVKKQSEGHEMALMALNSLEERFGNQTMSSSRSWLTGNLFGKRSDAEEEARLEVFGDDKPDKELVYAIAINPKRKRITVAFRGSVSPIDFITDACIELSNRENPLKEFPDQEKTIGIHHGFDTYLLKRRKTEDSKYTEIMCHVLRLFEENSRSKEYKLYVTGHSLGGALASLFAFEAAAEGKVPLPVTCVSVASPRVGNESFQKAFTRLEQEGYLRHLRLAHAQDPVTMMPKTTSGQMLALLSPIVIVALKAQEALFASQFTYRHTGVKLKFIGNGKKDNGSSFEWSYKGTTTTREELKDDDYNEKQEGGFLRSIKASSFSKVPGVAYHYGPVYMEILEKSKAELMDMRLNQVYLELVRG
jgi:hypothetical protein